MKKNYSAFYKTIFLALIIFIADLGIVSAQYCSPIFAIDCFSWRNQSISIDAINWTVGTCTDYDFTTDTAYLIAGNSYAMSVTNGDWCGCGVWIDFDNNSAFDSTENLFHLYTANQTNNYNFNISIPASVPTGIYRMRVIAGWGTDCYTSSSNGYGPCGSYQYGNFDDFTVSINALTTGATHLIENPVGVKVYPSPASDFIHVAMQEDTKAIAGLYDMAGRLVEKEIFTQKNNILNVSGLSPGIYHLSILAGDKSYNVKVLVR